MLPIVLYITASRVASSRSSFYKNKMFRKIVCHTPLLLCLLTIFAIIPASRSTCKLKKQSGKQIIDINGINGSIYKNINNFSNKFHYIISGETENKNFVTAPLAVNIALYMLAFGAKKETLTEIENALELKANPSTAKSYKHFLTELNNSSEVTLKVLNKLYISHIRHITEKFKQLTTNYFNSTTESISFTDEENAAKTINDWIAENTNNKIQNMIDPKEINMDIEMVYTNTIYFKGQWLYQFYRPYNIERTFYAHGKKDRGHKVSMMRGDRSFPNGSPKDLDAMLVEFPYKDKDFVMLIVVPNAIDGLKTLEEKLKTFSLKDLRKELRKFRLAVFLPKFKVETTINMKDILPKMGMETMFSSKQNWEGISRGIYISQFKQKVFIEINEDGTEAASAIKGYTMFKSPPPTLLVDHPFHYKIIKNTDDNEGVVLFSGNIYDVQ